MAFFVVGFFTILDFADPRVVEELGDAGSGDLVAVKALDDEIFGIARDVAPLFVGKLYFFVNYVLVYFFDVFSIKWSFA